MREFEISTIVHTRIPVRPICGTHDKQINWNRKVERYLAILNRMIGISCRYFKR